MKRQLSLDGGKHLGPAEAASCKPRASITRQAAGSNTAGRLPRLHFSTAGPHAAFFFPALHVPCAKQSVRSNLRIFVDKVWHAGDLPGFPEWLRRATGSQIATKVLRVSGPGSIYNASRIIFHNAPETGPETSTATSRRDLEKYEQYRNVLLAGLAQPHHDRDVLIDAKGEKVDGTCEWILENEYYKSLERGEISLLWISGGPGKGKTMMAIFLTQQLETLQDLKTIYFFCQAGQEKHRSATYVLRSLLWQLTSKQAELTEHFAHELGSLDRTESQMTRTLLWSAFVKVSCDPRLLATVCIIDGLDECDDDSRSWLADKIVGLNHDLEECSQAARPLRVIIISRSTIMELSQAKETRRVKLDPDNDDRINAGIETFVWTKVESLADRLEILSDPDRSKFVTSTGKKILEKAEGTFLWVGIVMMELLKEKTWTDVHAAIDKMPIGLPTLYDRMLGQIDPKHVQVCSRILLWLAVAFESLSVARLGSLLEGRPAHTEIEQRLTRDHLISCGPLVKINNDIVSLVHESARDHLLLVDEPDGIGCGPFRREARQAHLEVAHACIARILRCDTAYLKQGCYGLRSSMDFFSYYACVYWPKHARKSCELGDRLVDAFPAFFGAASKIRNAWWLAYSELRSTTILGRAKEPLEIHQACFLGIVPWVSSILHAQSKWPGRWISKRRYSRRGNADASSLAIAVQQEHIEVARLLLENHANVDSTGEGWDGTRTALHIALDNGDMSIAQLLLDHGASVKSRSVSNMTALHFAARSGADEEISRALLVRGAEVDARDKLGTTPLHLTRKHTIASTLIEHGADVNAVDSQGQKPMHHAANGSANIQATVRLLVEHGADINAVDSQGQTPLHYATKGYAREHTVRPLIEHGADVNVVNGQGQTPMHYAAEGYAEEDTVRLLVEHGADINAEDENGDTPLHKAVNRAGLFYMYDAKVSWLLLELGADIEARNRRGETPLHVASPFSACVPLAHRADPSARDNDGKTPLQCAQERGDRKLVSVLQHPWESGEEHSTFQAIREDFDRFVAQHPEWRAYESLRREYWD